MHDPPPRLTLPVQSGVQQHFEHLEPIDDWRPNTKSTFSCVDSRGTEAQLVRRLAWCSLLGAP